MECRVSHRRTLHVKCGEYGVGRVGYKYQVLVLAFAVLYFREYKVPVPNQKPKEVQYK